MAFFSFYLSKYCLAGNSKNDIIKTSESGEKNTLMFLQFKRKKRFSKGAFAICASFLFVLGFSFNALAVQDLSAYQKPQSGTLFYTDWNNLIEDFVNTWLPVSMNGPLGIGIETPLEQLHISGNFRLSPTTNASKNGVIYKGSNPFIHDFNYGNNGIVTTAGQNVFVGVGAGNFTMGASANDVGHASLNTVVGYEALHANTLGGGNSALGRFSLYSNTSGSGNSAIGVNSLYNNTFGSSNSAVGSSALFSNTGGSYNSALGYNAGRYVYDGTNGNTTGSYSVFLGHDSRALRDNQSNQIVIGYNAIGAGTNSVVLGNTGITKTVLRGNVGISTTSPQAALDVYDGNIFIRDAVITSLTPKAVITKEYLDSSLSSTTASIITQVATSSFWQGAMDDDIWNNNVGNVGIGTSEPAALFNVNGEALIGGNTLRYGTQYKLQVTGTDKGIYIGMPSLPTDANSGNAFGVGVISEGYTRGLFYSNGTYGIGPGNGVRDTFIGRSAANTLRIGSSYDLSGTANLLVNGKIGIGTLSPSGLVDLYNSAGSNLRITGAVNSINAGSIDLLEGTSLFSASGSYGVRLVYEGVANRFYIQTANNTTTSTRLTIARDTGNVGINTGVDNPLDKLHVIGNVRISGVGDCSGSDAVLRTDASGRLVCGTALSGSGTTNYVARWTGTNTLGKGVLYDNGTNVGIGTTDPGDKLTVNGNIQTMVPLSNNGYYAKDNAGSHIFSLTRQNNNLSISANASIGLAVGKSTPSSSYAMFLQSGTNNVGIGTTNPEAKLDIAGSLRASGAVSFTNPLFVGGGSRLMMVDDAGNLSATTTAAVLPPGTMTLPAGANGQTLRYNSGAWVANSTIYNNGTNVGIGTTAPGSKLDVQTAGYGFPLTSGASQTYGGLRISPPAASGNVVLDMGVNTGSGAWLQTTLRTNLATTYPLLLNPNGGNVGIGTTAPTQKLTVIGNVGFDSSKFTTDGSGNATFESFMDYSNSLYKLDPSSTSTSLYVAGTVSALGTATNNYFAGNVGIGTASPENSEGWMRVLNVYGSSNSKIITSTNLVQTGMWAHNSSYYSAPAGGFAGTKTNHPYSLITNGASRLTVSTNGNVGIGTTNPIAKFTLQQGTSAFSQYSGAFDMALGVTSDSALISGLDFKNFNSSGQVRLMARNNQNDYLVLNTFGSANTAVFFGQQGKDVSSVFSYGVADSDKKLAIGTFNAGDLILGTNNAERMRITSEGNVGIGMTNPTAKLDVNGTFRVSGVLNSVVLDKLSGSGSRIVMTDSSGSLYATSTTVATGLPDPSTAGNGATLRSNGSSWIANTNIFNNGDYVGIGTASPGSYRLYVNGNTFINGSLIVNTSTDTRPFYVARGSGIGEALGVSVNDAATTFKYTNDEASNRIDFILVNTDTESGGGVNANTSTVLSLLGGTTGGSVGINNAAPTQKLTVAGNVGFDTGKFTTDGSGNATFESFRDQSNALYKLDPSDTGTSLNVAGSVNSLGTTNSNYFAGNVGIGVADPSSKLFVVGHGRFGSSASAYLDVYGNGTSANVGQNVNSSIPVSVYGAGDVQINLDSNNNETNRVFSVRTNALQNGTELFRVQENGNVGIGTNQPVTLLHVNGNGATVDAMALITAFTSTRSRFAYWDPAAPNTKVAFGSGWGVATDFAVHTKTSGNFSELTQRLTVKNNGNVGIGTTSPVSLLDVNGLIKMRTALISQPEDVINKGYLESALSGGEGFSSLAGFWKLNGSDLYASSTSWNVGIGTASPAGKLSVRGEIQKETSSGIDGTWDNLIKYGHYNDLESGGTAANRWHGIDATITAGTAASNMLKFRLYHGSTDNAVPIDVMTLRGDGFVGIGATTPTKKLDVNGDLLVRNAATFSSSITASLLNGAAGRLVSVGADGTFGAISAASSGQTLRFTGSAWVPNSVIYNNGTNVGIGTASPSGKLGVLQNMSNYNSSFTSPHLKLQAGNIVDNTGFVGIAYEASTAPNYGWSSGSFRGSTSAALASFIWKYHNNDAAGVEYMRISHSGSVGIGITAPTKKLDVNGDLLVRNAATFSSSITASLLSGTAGRLVAVDASGTLYATSSSVATGLPEPTSAGDGATLRSNGTSWIANTNIFNNGTSVGIGTSNPGSLLTIANNNWISGRNSTDTGVVNMFKLNASNQIEVGAPLLIGPLEFAADSGLISFTDMPVTSASLVGTPQGYVMKIDGNNLLSVYSESNGSGGIQNSRVGIGTASPTQTLTVAGNVGFDSSKFTTDGSGNATFESFRDVSNSLYKLDPSDTNTSLYVAGTVSALGTATNNYFAGNVGIGTTSPGSYKLSVNGNTNVNGSVTWTGGNSSHLGTGANVTTYVGNSSVNNAIIRSNDNNNDAWLMNWGNSPAYGIYNRNIDSDLAVSGALTVPSNSTAFIGGGLAKAYIQHSTGNAGFAGTLSVGGNATFSQPVIVGAPTNPAHAATKNYVDSIVATTSDFSVGFWTKSSGKLYPTDTSLNVGIGVTNPLAKLHLNGGLIMKTSFVANTNYTAQAADYIIAYSSITADRTVTLPNSLCTPGRFFVIIDQSGSANSSAKIIIDPEGTTPIVGGATFMISNPYNAVYVFCGNNAWFLL